MADSSTRKQLENSDLFQHHNKLLNVIKRQSLHEQEQQGLSFIYKHFCDGLREILECNLIWAGDIDREQCHLIPLASSPATSFREVSIQHHIARLLIKQFGCSLEGFTRPLYLFIDPETPPEGEDSGHYCLVCPLDYQERRFGFLALHCGQKDKICDLNQTFIESVIDDIALALYSQDTALRLKQERDLNREIIDSIQALMVTISHCGTILSFNRKAEDVTGFKEQETIGKYWVDVLINPYNRRKFQRLFSSTLRSAETSINFKAPLLSKSGEEHYISWHRSIQRNIETGKVGLVMIGIDETDTLAADQQLNRLTARWEKIFNAIHDPVLVVSNDNIILDANPAACAAAKKRSEDVIGKKVCDILHGGHSEGTQCPLEQFIGYQKTRISETTLAGLYGTYMLTVSPLVEENDEVNASLLVARNLTEEEVVRAEAIRVAQLAAIGELASGVAHEINNPINTIINYAQIIMDDPSDVESVTNLNNIISEGKRIAGIASNLLSFARCREELYSHSAIDRIIEDSLQLVTHLLKRDGITWHVTIEADLPMLMCNRNQLQQVILNIISNARYALNKKYPRPCPGKQLIIAAMSVDTDTGDFIRLEFTDYGIGIAPEIQGRLFDPFFSTKPKGEGTGLGLSVSYGLIKDHGGHIKFRSEPGKFTTFIIDLPVNQTA